MSALMGREGADFHSPELQLAAIRRNTEALQEVAVIEDIDVSGRTFSRDGLDKIRRMVERRQVDVIHVYDYSRLGRNVSEATTFIKWLADRGVQVRSANEPVDHTTPEGKLMLNQFLGMAQFFSDVMSRRWSDVLEHRVRQQGLSNGTTQTGYLRVGKGEPHVIDPVLGPVVKDIIERYANGEGTPSLAALLGAARGKPCAAGVLRKMVTSPFYIGMSRSRGEWLPGRHEPLIDEKTHRRALQRARRDANLPPRAVTPIYSLSGLIFCGVCKARACTHVVTEHGRPRRITIMCTAQIRSWPKSCNGFGTPRLERIERLVVGEVREKVERLRSDPDEQLARQGERAKWATQRETLERQLAQIAAAMSKLTTRWAREQIPDATFQQTLTGLKRDEAAALTALAAIDLPDDEPAAAEMVELGDYLLRLWDDMDGPTRGQALRTLVKRITINRGDTAGGQAIEVEFR